MDQALKKKPTVQLLVNQGLWPSATIGLMPLHRTGIFCDSAPHRNREDRPPPQTKEMRENWSPGRGYLKWFL